MNKLDDWQPLFRFLRRVDDSQLVGVVFSAIYLIGVTVAWYYVCFKKGSESWRSAIVAWNKKFGVNVEWVTPFILKIGISLLFFGSILGLSLVLMTKIVQQH